MNCLSFYLGLLVAVSSCLGDDRETISSLLSEREKLFQSFSVKAMCSDSSDGTFSGNVTPQLSDMWMTVDGGRYRCTRDGEDKNSGGRLFKSKRTGVFVGGESLVLTELSNSSNCLVSTDLAQIPWPVPLFDVLTLFQGKAFSSIVLEPSWTMTKGYNTISFKNEKINGVEGGLPFRESIVVDIANGYTIREISTEVKLNPLSDFWISNLKIVIAYQNDKVTGFHLPQKAVYEINGCIDGVSTIPVKRAILEFSEWQFPAVINENTFKVSIPNGTLVDDKVRDKKYVYHRIDDQTIAHFVATIPERPRGKEKILLFMTISVFLTLLYLLFFHKKKEV